MRGSSRWSFGKEWLRAVCEECGSHSRMPTLGENARRRWGTRRMLIRRMRSGARCGLDEVGVTDPTIPCGLRPRGSWGTRAGAFEEEVAFAGVAGQGGGAFEFGAGFGVAV